MTASLGPAQTRGRIPSVNGRRTVSVCMPVGYAPSFSIHCFETRCRLRGRTSSGGTCPGLNPLVSTEAVACETVGFLDRIAADVDIRHASYRLTALTSSRTTRRCSLSRNYSAIHPALAKPSIAKVVADKTRTAEAIANGIGSRLAPGTFDHDRDL